MNSPAIIRQRRDSASAWTSANPILHSGQLGFELDTRKLKIGNGEDEWNDLPYVGTPLDATYLVKDSNGDLTAERVVGNSTSIVANWDTAGAVSFELTNTAVTPATYRSVTVDAQGRVTGGTNPTDTLSNSTTSTQNGYFGDIYLYDDSTPSHYLQITNSANLTAARVFSINVNDNNRTLNLSGDLTLAHSLTTSGNFPLTFTTTAATTLTLPTLGTVATTSNKISDFAACTSSDLLEKIADETGSGLLVFATSPTFTTSVLTSDTGTFSVFNTNATTINAFGAATAVNIGASTGTTTINNNLAVTGNFIINGTTTTVNSTTVTIDDPIFTLGGDTAPATDDNKDRGIEFRWRDEGGAKVGFFGFDDSAGKFTFIPNASNSSEVFSGTAGDVVFGAIAGTTGTFSNTIAASNFSGSSSGTNTGDQTIQLIGDVTGSGAGSFATTIANSAVTLAKIENLAANTVIGNATASAAVPTAINAATDGHVLRRSGSTLGFGTIATAGISDDAVTFSKFQNSATAGLSIIGRNTNSAGDFAEINAATDGHVLRRNGNSLEFNTVATEGIANSAVTYAKIQNVSTTARLLGRTSAGAGVVEEVPLGAGLTFSSGNLVFSVGTANQILFNNSSGNVNGNGKFTYNSSNDTLTIGSNFSSSAPRIESGFTSFNILPTTVTAINIGDLASIEFGKSIAAARNYNFGNSAASHATLRVYGEAIVTGAVRVGSSTSGSIQDSTGTTKISFTNTETTISGTGGITLTGNTIKSNTATAITLSENDATISGHITSNEGYRLGASAVNAQTGTTYTLALTDNGRIVTCNNANAITVTIPTGLPANFTCTVVALGAGKVTLSQNSTTLNWYGGTGNVAIAGQYGAATLLMYASNVFHVSGTLQ